jgi:glycosyltransferase involved in cell wall biosynthesis
MVNVLWLTKGLGRGGAERLLVDSLRHVDRGTFRVEVAYLLPWKDALVSDLEAQGACVRCFGNRYPFDGRWVLDLRRFVAEHAIDIVHTHMPYVGVAARLAVLPGRPAVVHTEHNLWSRYRPPTRVANMLTYGMNQRVIAVSRAVADSIRVPPWLPVRLPPVDVVYHGADLGAVHSGAGAHAHARHRLQLADDTLAIGSVGNFTAKKDQVTLLHAFATLTCDHPSARLVLVGTGPLEAQLRATAGDLGIGDRVVFTGMRDDVNQLLPGFDVFALSSRFEGLPISLLEAMATGLPCVATRVGGIPEVVHDGLDGLLVEPGDPQSLAISISKLLLDDRLRGELGANAAATARNFDLRRAVSRTQEIYESVLATR